MKLFPDKEPLPELLPKDRGDYQGPRWVKPWAIVFLEKHERLMTDTALFLFVFVFAFRVFLMFLGK